MKSSDKPGEKRSETEKVTHLPAVCGLCGNKITDLNDPTLWKQVVGWVGGPKKDHMRLRADTGEFAHDECVKKVAEGQAPDQPSIFEAPEKEEEHYLTKGGNVVPMEIFEE